MTDYSLWEVILNGDSPIPTRVVDGVVQLVASTSAKQRLAKKNELKAQGTLLMASPDKHQLKFNIHKEAKSLMEAIEKWFQDINPKFLRSLLTEWRTHTLIWRNKTDLEDQSLDDLFNNLKIFEAEVKSSSPTSPTTQNIGFVSLQNNDSTNKAVSAITSVFAASTKLLVSALPNMDNLSDAVIYSFFASQSNSPQRNVSVETSTSNALVSQCDGVGSYDWSFQADAEPTNYALTAFTYSSSSSSDNEVAPCLESLEARIIVYQKNETMFEEDITLLKLDVMLRDNALVELRRKFKKAEKEREEFKLNIENFQTFSKNLSQLLAIQITNKTRLGYDNQVFNSTMFDCDELLSSESDVSMPTSSVHDRYKSGERYHDVPPPYTGTFMPPKPDLVFHDAPTAIETVPAARMTHPHPYRRVGPITVLTRSRLVPVTDARPVTTDVPQTKVQHYKPTTHGVNKAHSPIRRPINHKTSPKNSNFHQQVITVKATHVNVVQGIKGNLAEAVNTAYYVQNRVLVTKPYNKTPYELLLGRTHSIGFMRPFDCPVTILNTLDPLEKFDGKVDEGFLVGYSVSTKAFRVFNSRTIIVQETLHINFIENKPNVEGSEPTWLFDIDTLIQSMNYQPVVVGNQPNASVDPHNTDADAFNVKEPEFVVHVSLSSCVKTKKHDDKTKARLKTRVLTNTFSVAGPSNTTVSLTFKLGGKSSYVDPSQYPDDPDMPALEDITYSDDDEDVDLCKAFEKLMKDKFHMSSIGELTFFLRLQVKQKQDGIFISQDKYVAEILRKFGLTDGKLASTPIDTEKPLLKDPDGIPQQGFSEVDTPLFADMLVPQQAQGVEDATEDEDAVNEVSDEPTPPSATPATPPPPPQQEHIPSPPQAATAQLSPPPQQPPSHDAGISITLLNTLLETCAFLTKQVANLEQDKVSQAIEITKLKQRLTLLWMIKRIHPNRGKGIAELDVDEDATLEEVDVEVTKDTDVLGRLEEYQAKVYHLDLEHSDKVLSMQETDKAEPAEVEEVIKVVTAAKLMIEVVTTATTTITIALVHKASALRKRRGVIIQDLEKAATASLSVQSEVKAR
nr:retrovirus-related Pol polyprotein from transposon TNT 1-94 [Tanacetum cinerariifolium]